METFGTAGETGHLQMGKEAEGVGYGRDLDARLGCCGGRRARAWFRVYITCCILYRSDPEPVALHFRYMFARACAQGRASERGEREASNAEVKFALGSTRTDTERPAAFKPATLRLRYSAPSGDSESGSLP